MTATAIETDIEQDNGIVGSVADAATSTVRVVGGAGAAAGRGTVSLTKKVGSLGLDGARATKRAFVKYGASVGYAVWNLLHAIVTLTFAVVMLSAAVMFMQWLFFVAPIAFWAIIGIWTAGAIQRLMELRNSRSENVTA